MMNHFRLASLLMLTAGAAHAQVSDSATSSGAVASAAASATAPSAMKAGHYVTADAAGMVVVIDRANGSTRALTAEEAQHLAQGIKELLGQSTDGLVQVQRADGSVSMDLQGRFQSVMLAKKEDDGSISQACVETAADAAAFFEIDPNLIDAATRSVSQATTPAAIR